jgi:hypothetical protein
MKLRTATLLITIGASVVVSCSSSRSRVIDGESHLMSSNVDIRELEYRPVAQGRRFQMFTFAVARSMNQLPSRRDDRMISPTSLSFILDDAAHRLR